MLKKLVIIVAIIPVTPLGLCAQNTFYSSGNKEIDKVRKAIDEHPTNEENYRKRTVLLYNWLGALQQQGADTRSLYQLDKRYYELQSLINREDGKALRKAQNEIFAVIDSAYQVLEKIQTGLVENGMFFEPFTGNADDFPDTGNMDAEWPMFQANKHNSGHTEAPGPKRGIEKWKFPVGLGWYARPAVEGDTVYVASPGLRNTSFAVNLNTGEEIWKSTQEHPIFGVYKYPAIASTPVVLDDKIILREINSHGGNSGQAKNLVYIDKKTGKTLARKYAGHIDYRARYASVASNGENVCYPFGVHDIYSTPPISQNFNRLICADKNNNRQLWDFNVGNIDNLAEPVMSEEKVFQGTTEGYLYALNIQEAQDDERIAWNFKANGAINTRVELKGGDVFFGSNGGSVYRVNAQTGELIWETTVDEVEKGARKHFSTATAVEDHLYIGAANNYLYSFNVKNGELLWKYKVEDWIRSKPVVTPKGIMAASIDGKLHLIDKNGSLIWEKNISSHPIYADLVFAKGKILVTDSNLSLYAVDLNGNEIWQRSILSSFKNNKGERIFTDELSGGTYYQSKPTAVKGKIYFGTPAGFLYAVDAESGQEIWKFEMGAAISVGPAIQDGKVYAGQQGGERFFYSLDAETGDLIWKQTIPGGWVWGSATVDDGMVYVPTVNGYAVCLDGETGNIVWMYRTAKSIPAEPAIDGDLVYFGSWSRTLYAFNKKTGEINWKVNGIGLDSGTLIAQNEKIFVPHHNNIFMSFDATSGKILSEGNKNEEKKGQYSSFNATPAFSNTNNKAFFTARVGRGLGGVPMSSKVYSIDTKTSEILWTFPDGGGLSAPALASGRVYIASGNTPFLYCLDQNTGEPCWIHKLGKRVEESTLCIYRDKLYVLAADGYLHAIY